MSIGLFMLRVAGRQKDGEATCIHKKATDPRRVSTVAAMPGFTLKEVRVVDRKKRHQDTGY